MGKFKVGDRVAISHPANDGEFGYVDSINPERDIYSLRLGCSNRTLDFHEDWLTKVEEDYTQDCSAYTPKDINEYMWEWVNGSLEIKDDNVNNPSHYGQGRIEAIEYIEDFLTQEEYIGYLRGNIAKYLHRFRYKNGLEDLKKANWYLDRLMFLFENKKDL